MARVPRWAEKRFSLYCSDGDAVCTPPDEDINGWDFLVELPDQPHTGPQEGKPAKRQAFVQLKSTVTEGRRVQVKLSNMLNAARSQDPWFIFLITRSPDADAEEEVFGLHFWGEHIEHTLKKVREASVSNIPLNTRRVSIDFPPSSKVSRNVVSWMQQEISLIAGNYSGEKRQIYESSGYESGYGVGHLTVSASSQEEIFRAFLGLGSGLNVQNFTFTPSRFNIPDLKPEIEESGGRIHITPTPAAECELRLKGSFDEPALVLLGHVYALALPEMPIEKRRVRISAPPVEFVIGPDQANQIDLSAKPATRRPLQELEAFARLRQWWAEGPVDIQVWVNKKYMYGGTVGQNRQRADTGPDWLFDVVKCLSSFGPPRNGEVLLSIEDIDAETLDLAYMVQVLSEGPMKIEFPSEEDLPEIISCFLYYSEVDVGEWTFATVVKRAVRSDRKIEGMREVIVSQPRIVDRLMYLNASDDERSQIETSYNKILQELESAEHPLAFGNINEYLKKQYSFDLSQD